MIPKLQTFWQKQPLSSIQVKPLALAVAVGLTLAFSSHLLPESRQYLRSEFPHRASAFEASFSVLRVSFALYLAALAGMSLINRERSYREGSKNV